MEKKKEKRKKSLLIYNLIHKNLKPEVGKTCLILIKLYKCPRKVHHVDECYKQLYNLAQGHNTAISLENENDPLVPFS